MKKTLITAALILLCMTLGLSSCTADDPADPHTSPDTTVLTEGATDPHAPDGSDTPPATEPVTEPEPDSETETETEVAPVTDTATGSATESDPEPVTPPETESETEPETETETETKPAPPTNQMPAQIYRPENHTPGDDILQDAFKDYIRDDPDNEYAYSPPMPSQGSYHALVIPVEFSNDRFTKQELSDLALTLNGTPDDTGWHSVRSYYKASSYGLLDLTFDLCETPVQMPKRYSSYEYSETGSTDILAYALAAVDAAIDLSRYDTDSDGYIDAVYLVYSAPVNYEDDASNYWAFVDWAYESDLYDGVAAHAYFFSGIDFIYEETEGSGWYGIDGLKLNAATYIHETGHLLGLDDYYDYNPDEGADKGLGNADMMDYSVGDHNAYSKLLLGWVTPTVITETTTVNLGSFAETGECLMILLDYDGTYFSEYLLIDFYTATGVNRLHADLEGSYLYDGEPFGARIYHVSSSIKQPYSDDYGSFTDHNNSMTATPLIKLIEADGDENYESDTYYEDDGTYRYASYDDLWQSGDTLSRVQPGYARHDGKLLNFDITFDRVTRQGASVTVSFSA